VRVSKNFSMYTRTIFSKFIQTIILDILKPSEAIVNVLDTV